MQGNEKTPKMPVGINCGKVVDIFKTIGVCITFHTMPVQVSK
jgi:hypothetical protein